MSIELKIKSKHLALEPAIIRKEEQKLSKKIKHYQMKHQINLHGVDAHFEMQRVYPDLYKLWFKHSNLISHRKWDVRNEARATFLARAYIKGVPYKVVEPNVRDALWAPVMDSLIRMVMKYGSVRYRPDYDESRKVIKTAEAKAKEDILKWLEQ